MSSLGSMAQVCRFRRPPKAEGLVALMPAARHRTGRRALEQCALDVRDDLPFGGLYG